MTLPGIRHVICEQLSILLLAMQATTTLAKSNQQSDKPNYQVKPLYRFKNPLSHIKISPKGHYLAFLENQPSAHATLKLLEFSTGRIFSVTSSHVGPSFVWAPHGYRLFYRAQVRNTQNNKTISQIDSFDAYLKKRVHLESFSGRAGFLSLDPRSLRIRTLTNDKIHVHKISYPGSRLAEWQKSRAGNNKHFWIANQNGILLGGRFGKIKHLVDDGTPIDSFSISHDGQFIAWATKASRIYISRLGEESHMLDFGRHPSWHHTQNKLVYSGGRRVGSAIGNYDLKLYVQKSHEFSWLTHSQHSNESWPVFDPKNQSLYYSKLKTSDLYTLQLNTPSLAHKTNIRIKN